MIHRFRVSAWRTVFRRDVRPLIGSFARQGESRDIAFSRTLPQRG